jgi:hypothetical protein
MKLFKNNKGASLSTFTEVALFSVLIIGLLVIISTQMNAIYGANNDLSFGMSGMSNSTLNELKSYQGTLKTGATGDATTNALTGINLATVWGMILGGVNLVWNFVTGFWIEQGVGLMHLGEAGTILAVILRIAFVFSIGFIIIKLIMKVKA